MDWISCASVNSSSGGQHSFVICMPSTIFVICRRLPNYRSAIFVIRRKLPKQRFDNIRDLPKTPDLEIVNLRDSPETPETTLLFYTSNNPLTALQAL